MGSGYNCFMAQPEIGHWEYSASTQQYISNLSKLELSIANGIGKGIGINLYIAGATWLLTGRGDVVLTALATAGIAAAAVFVPSETTIPPLKWIARMRDKGSVYIKPSDQNPKI